MQVQVVVQHAAVVVKKRELIQRTILRLDTYFSRLFGLLFQLHYYILLNHYLKSCLGLCSAQLNQEEEGRVLEYQQYVE